MPFNFEQIQYRNRLLLLLPLKGYVLAMVLFGKAVSIYCLGEIFQVKLRFPLT